MRATPEYVERLIREGKRPSWIAHITSWRLEEVEALVERLGGCTHEACGQPQVGPGHPRKGWVRIQQASGHGPLWFGGWRCAGRHVHRQYAAQQRAESA